MTEIFTRINKDKYNVNFTTDSFDKYLFVQNAARSCVDSDAPATGGVIPHEKARGLIDGTRAGCTFCSGCSFTKEPFDVTTARGNKITVTFHFCPHCGRELKGA